jgi:DNA-binding transcriptional LysR family regulator
MLDLDLKLLAIFEEVYKAKSVSQAADNLRIAQPTVSMGLRKLRQRFNDPLFTRTSTGMEPTPRAADLWQPLTDAHRMIEDALRHKVTFDPKKSERCFRVCMSDISQIVLLPDLVNHMHLVAPQIRIEVIPIAADTPKLLESADADLTIGFMPSLEAGYFEQTLFNQAYVCVARADHPRIRKTLTLKNFADESHLEFVTSGTGHWIVEKTLEDKKIQPRIALRLPNFLGMAAIVASTDLIATVPQRLAAMLAKSSNIRMFTPPISIPTFAVKQHWHVRFHKDPRNIWMRETVANLFLEESSER